MIHRESQVYSPYQKNWITYLNARMQCVGPSPLPNANVENIQEHHLFGPLFNTPVPNSVEGFELDESDHMKMYEVWPAGTAAANEVIQAPSL